MRCKVVHISGLRFICGMVETVPQGWDIAEFKSTEWVWEEDSSECDLSATSLVLTGHAS